MKTFNSNNTFRGVRVRVCVRVRLYLNTFEDGNVHIGQLYAYNITVTHLKCSA